MQHSPQRVIGATFMARVELPVTTLLPATAARSTGNEGGTSRGMALKAHWKLAGELRVCTFVGTPPARSEHEIELSAPPRAVSPGGVFWSWSQVLVSFAARPVSDFGGSFP